MDETTLVDVLILEPFYGGSHKVLIDTLTSTFENGNISFDLLTLPAKKWHWKARTSVLQFSALIHSQKSYKTVFCSSVLNLCELIGLHPWLSKCKKVVYFHENQLEYPLQKEQERDFQYAYNQILTTLTADVVLFNSEFNMNSFLSKIKFFLKRIPGFKPNDLDKKIVPKCSVLYFPIIATTLFQYRSSKNDSDVLHIVWAHRWEHDKNPEAFFDVLSKLKEDGFYFLVSVMGEQYNELPSVFEEAREKLGSGYIKQWGFVLDKSKYYEELSACDVAVSTALHEFFGVSMIEAVHLGCFPLCPNRLVYPEIFPANCLYNTQQQLYKKLKQYCKNKHLVKVHYDKSKFDLNRFAWDTLKPKYLSCLR